MQAPPDPQTQRAALAGDPKAKCSNQHQQTYSASVETQAAFFVLLPIVVPVVLLAIAGGRQ
jgi:hypothetical protein